MEHTEFVERLEKVGQGAKNVMNRPDLDQQTDAALETLAEQALALKTQGKKDLPDHYSKIVGAWTVDRWLWSSCNDLRNLLIDYLGLPLEKH